MLNDDIVEKHVT